MSAVRREGRHESDLASGPGTGGGRVITRDRPPIRRPRQRRVALVRQRIEAPPASSASGRRHRHHRHRGPASSASPASGGRHRRGRVTRGLACRAHAGCSFPALARLLRARAAGSGRRSPHDRTPGELSRRLRCFLVRSRRRSVFAVAADALQVGGMNMWRAWRAQQGVARRARGRTDRLREPSARRRSSGRATCDC